MLEAPSRWYFVLNETARILVADDDPIFCEFAAVHLATPTVTIETAKNGQVAWDLLQNQSFDLALVDIEMPGLNGFEVVERVRRHPKIGSMPIIIVTGREDIASIDRAFEFGATSFAVKPINWRLLSHQIKYVMRMTAIEHTIRNARDKAEHHSSQKSHLLAMMRHEINTALHSIIGFSDLMASERNGPLLPPYKEYSEHIRQSGNSLAKSFSEMMNYAQLLSNEIELSEDKYRLADLLHLAVTAAQESRVEVAYPDDALSKDLRLICDRAQFVRMLSLIINNAIATDGVKIKVTWQMKGEGRLSIQIWDEGAANLQDHCDSLQVVTSHADNTWGVQRRIEIDHSRRIAEMHGGFLTLSSPFRQGTMIEILLPDSRVDTQAQK